MTETATVHELPLSDILMNEDLQVRRKLDASAIANCASIYKSGGSMTPVRVARIKDGGPLMLVDGWHRIAALRSLGRGRVDAEVFETTMQGARWEAARAKPQARSAAQGRRVSQRVQGLRPRPAAL